MGFVNSKDNYVRTCIDFEDGPSCCSSCHEDYDLGYDQELEVYDSANNLRALVCCQLLEVAKKWTKKEYG